MGENPLSNQAIMNAGLSRRRFLGALGIGGTAAVLAACSSGGDTAPAPSASASTAASTPAASGAATPEPSSAPSVDFTAPEAASQEDKSDTDKALNWGSWTAYLDESEQSTRKKRDYPTLNKWMEESGIKVNYDENAVPDNLEFLASVEKALKAKEDTGWDLVVLTDWMAAQFVANGWAMKFDKANMPNAVANLLPQWQGVPFDPNRDYTMPWFSGFSGLGYNIKELKKLTGKDKITTVSELWDPALKGKVTVLSEMRDTMGCVLADLGFYPDDFSDEEYNQGIGVLQQQIDSGQMLPPPPGGQLIQALEDGKVVAAIAWSGDVYSLGEGFGFTIPELGGVLWTDNMLIPAMAAHKKNAELTINNYYDPMVAATVAAWVQYISPVRGAQQAMQTVDPSLVNNSYIFPTASDLNRAYVFMTLDADQEARYQKQFRALSR